ADRSDAGGEAGEGDLRVGGSGGRADALATRECDEPRGGGIRLEAIQAGVVAAQDPDGGPHEPVRRLRELAGGGVLAVRPGRGGLPHEPQGSTAAFFQVILRPAAGCGNRVPRRRVWSIVTGFPRSTTH